MPSKKPSSPKSKPVANVDEVKLFEKLLKDTDVIKHYQLRLYITGTSVRSTQAVSNIRSLCEEFLPGRYELSVVDIYQQPEEAGRQQIIAAPTLVKELPMPPKRLIGNLSDRDKVMVGLDLAEHLPAN
jgi:circadian clock protein KaiB